ncbi:type IV pilus modification protein PilV [Nitrincola sp. MINF-07-Sa-05]|uniref:type IV pilus modification protein PilV n=1 Tax=Nitrincola salilacus TaxID=3400273 RepID=UPI0039182F2F
MSPAACSAQHAKSHGFTLLEVLITLLVLGFGLLGLAGLQARMLNAEFEAYQRTHAVMLAEDIASRIKANPSAARAGDYSGATVYGTGNVMSTTCDPTANLVTTDLCAWNRNLLGAATTTSGGDNIGAMLGARGCIETIPSAAPVPEVQIRVTVTWQGTTPTVVQGVDCAAGMYGDDDSLRRAVSLTVMLAFLGV